MSTRGVCQRRGACSSQPRGHDIAKDIQITFDCADPAALARFWAEALGYQRQPPPEGFGSWEEALTAWGVPAERQGDMDALVDPEGAGPRMFFQKVPEGKTAKNRLHLDLRSAPGLHGDQRMAALETEAARLTGLGARREARFEPGGMSEGHLVMTDPEGNEFCLD